MYQAEFDEVRDLIEQERYDEARMLLKTIDHPLREKWLIRLEEANPLALTPLDREMQLEHQRERLIQDWVRREKQIGVLTGGALVLFAVYLRLVENVFWLFSPDLVVNLLPPLVLAAGLYVVWLTRKEARLRQHILKMNPTELRNVSAVLLPSAGLITLVTLVMGNTAQFFAAGSLIVVAILNYWRAVRAEELRDL